MFFRKQRKLRKLRESRREPRVHDFRGVEVMGRGAGIKRIREDGTTYNIEGFCEGRLPRHAIWEGDPHHFEGLLLGPEQAAPVRTDGLLRSRW